MRRDDQQYWDLRRALFQVMDQEKGSALLDILERANALDDLRIEGPFTISIVPSANLTELASRSTQLNIEISQLEPAYEISRILIQIHGQRANSRQNLLSPSPNRLQILRSPLSSFSSSAASPRRGTFTPISINPSPSPYPTEEMEIDETPTPQPPHRNQ